MRKIVWIILLLPFISYSQSKRKKRLAEEKADAELVTRLRSHVQYLSSDHLEGRRTGTAGEMLALQYLAEQYRQIGLEPAGTAGYVQEFEINEGKQVDAATGLKIEEKPLQLTTDYFPLAFSATRHVKGAAAMALNEPGQPWFLDLKDLLEENRGNLHFDVEAAIKKAIATVAAKSATALIVYNTSAIADHIQFNKYDTTTAVKIPVLYITQEGLKKYFSDRSATFAIDLDIRFSMRSRKARNLVGRINNHAATTVILGAHYDHLGYGEDRNALDTGHVIHNGADDNASGSAALLELARMLKAKPPANNNYLIIHFSGEELGLYGSKYWLEHSAGNIIPNYMINMDMVGRYDTAHKLIVGGYGTSPAWGDIWKATATKLLVQFDSTGSGPSDHASFYRKNIPVQFFFTGSHSDYHKASDDWNKVNYDGQKEIVKLVYELIMLADTRGRLTFTQTAEPSSKVAGQIKEEKKK